MTITTTDDTDTTDYPVFTSDQSVTININDGYNNFSYIATTTSNNGGVTYALVESTSFKIIDDIYIQFDNYDLVLTNVQYTFTIQATDRIGNTTDQIVMVTTIDNILNFWSSSPSDEFVNVDTGNSEGSWDIVRKETENSALSYAQNIFNVKAYNYDINITDIVADSHSGWFGIIQNNNISGVDVLNYNLCTSSAPFGDGIALRLGYNSTTAEVLYQIKQDGKDVHNSELTGFNQSTLEAIRFNIVDGICTVSLKCNTDNELLLPDQYQTVDLLEYDIENWYLLFWDNHTQFSSFTCSINIQTTTR